MIRAALAVKKREGSVSLTAEQIETIERVSGQKYENTWLGKNNEGNHPLEIDEDGKFIILDVIKAEEKAAEEERHRRKQAVKENSK